jgi:hypothetical protein
MTITPRGYAFIAVLGGVVAAGVFIATGSATDAAFGFYLGAALAFGILVLHSQIRTRP